MTPSPGTCPWLSEPSDNEESPKVQGPWQSGQVQLAWHAEADLRVT